MQPDETDPVLRVVRQQGSPFGHFDRLPSVAEAVATTRIALYVEAMIRTGGNVMKAAAMVRGHRERLRATLKKAGLYPWPKSPPDTAAAFVAVLFGLRGHVEPKDEP